MSADAALADVTGSDVQPDAVGLLDAYDAGDFSAAEHLIQRFLRQPYTPSGFPRVRPSDCGRITDALQKIMMSKLDLFRLGDSYVVEQFERLVDAFSRTDIRAYENELQRLLVLQARTRLLRNDPAGALAIVGPFADRPYTIQTDFFGMMDFLALDLQCKSALGRVDGLADAAVARARLLVSLRPMLAWDIAWRFANFLGFHGAGKGAAGVLEWFVRFWSSAVASSRRMLGSLNAMDPGLRDPNAPPPGGVGRIALVQIGIYSFLAGWNLWLLRFADIRLPRKASREGRVGKPEDILVTRAMGGIGDLLMMTPGLRALARRYGRPVKMAVPKKFFGVFANLPYVELVDIDGAPFELSSFRKWFNLSICPASAYETPRRPLIDKGRVELFARGMGVKRKQLAVVTEKVDIVLGEEEKTFVEEFRATHGLGKRPLVGVQPFSREEYRNYPRMNEAILEMAQNYDVLIFHHVADGLPSGPGILTTAGQSLRKSFALVSLIDVLVTVDSSFLHAASAFDTPVVALFGPIDGRMRTTHLKHSEVIALNDQFPCAPCWRNEDENCLVTNHTGVSPCLSSIPRHRVLGAVRRALAARPERAHAV